MIKIQNSKNYAGVLNLKFRILSVRHTQGGFTLVEILISVSIIVLLASFGFVSFLNSRRVRDLNAATQSILSVLRAAQTKSLSGEAGERWGVHLESGRYTLFPALNPFSSNTASNTVYVLPATLEISNVALNGGGQDVIFERISGKTSQSGGFDIMVQSSVDSMIVTIEDSGDVSSGGSTQAPVNSRVTDTRHRNFNLGWSIKNSSTLTLTFFDPPSADVVSSINMTTFFNADKSKFDWSGTTDVYGASQTLRVHTVALTDTNTTLSVDRSRQLNNKKAQIKIDGKEIATYESDGSLTIGQFGGSASEP